MHEETTQTTIEIQAVDTLFFRNAKPFTMGDETGAQGMFPPSPSVLYGVLRSAYLAENPEYISKAGTEDDPTNALRITAIALQIGKKLMHPLPCDLVKQKHPDDPDKENWVYPLTRHPKAAPDLLSSLPTENILRFSSDEVVEAFENGLISSHQFRRYVDGTFKPGEIRKLADCLKDEPKIGIARHDATHSSREGALYRVDMQRPEVLESLSEEQHRESPLFQTTTMRFLVRFTGLEHFPKRGVVRIGGEGKAATFLTIDDPFTIQTPQIDPACFKVYLSTPAVFDKGWLPGYFEQDDEQVWRGTLPNGARLTLLAGAIGRCQPIGGFDMAKRMPKPLRRMVPAGSVYYFKLDSTPEDMDKDVNKVREIFGQQAISDSEDYRKQGFGISYIAKEGV